MWWSKAEKPSIGCTRVWATKHRPGSEGTYIVRLSPDNVRRLKLKVRNGAYLKVSYGKASVLACLSVDCDLPNDTIRIDQTLRTAICLEKIMQGPGKRELVYSPDGRSDLEYPIVIRRSNFRGPSPLAKLLKQQYLICVVHHALPTDMETPLARLTTLAMEAIGIQPGDKVWLIGDNGRKKIRCLPLDPGIKLPLPSMGKHFTPPCPETDYQELTLPWITIDLQSRLDLNQTGLDSNNVNPWDPIIVGRDLPHALASEFSTVAMGVALSAVGGAVVVPEIIITDVYSWLPLSIILTGFVAVSLLVALKIRSRI